MDNYFTSLSLADEMYSKDLSIIGTLRSNKVINIFIFDFFEFSLQFFFEKKVEIPPEFLKNRNREILTTLSAFKDFKTLISYVPKLNKAVILLSTFHHKNSIVETNNRKPQMILDYNQFKGTLIIKLFSKLKNKTNYSFKKRWCRYFGSFD